MNSNMRLLMLGNLVVGSGSLVIAGILTPISRDLHVSVATAGQFMTAYALAFALSAPMVAVLLGKWCRKRVLMLALGLFALAAGLGAVSPNFEMMLASRVLAGIAGAMFSPNAAAVATLLAPPEQRGRAIAVVFGGFTLATVFGVPLGSYLGLQIGWRETLAQVSAASVIMLIFLVRGLPEGLQVPRVQLAGWVQLGRDKTVLMLLGVSLLQIAGTYTVFGFIGPFLANRVQSASADQIALMLMLFGAAGFIGNWLGGRAIDRFGPAKITAVNITLVTAGLLTVAQSEGSLTVLLTGIVLWGGNVFSINTAQQTLLVTYKPALTAALLPANSSVLFAGQALGTLAGGLALSSIPGSGFDLLPLIGAAFAVAALGLLSLVTLLSPQIKDAAEPADGLLQG